jgi:hypothetical protein
VQGVHGRGGAGPMQSVIRSTLVFIDASSFSSYAAAWVAAWGGSFNAIGD